jgi:hypothetical protein
MPDPSPVSCDSQSKRVEGVLLAAAPVGAGFSVGKSEMWAGVFLVVMLPVVAWRNLEMLNPDAVAYLRIASYYVHGRTDLAISGYWGPLLSWGLAPLIAVGMEPLIAARIVMAISAIIFWLGCVAVYRIFPLPKAPRALGAWLAALAAIGWSVRFITPDLLASGLICFAIARTIRTQQWDGTKTWIAPALAGTLWGLAYLAKAIALPFALVFICGTTLLEYRLRSADTARMIRCLFLTLLTLALVAAPWVAVLSLKYHTLTFSTTARIAHAVAGPHDLTRQHPFAMQFHRPEAGRITSWEEPSLMPYRYWSPLENGAYALHQLQVIGKNFLTMINMMTRMNLLVPLLLVVLAFALSRSGERTSLASEPWFLALIPVLALAMVYAPFFLNVEDQRYFYAAFPFLWVSGFGALNWLASRFMGQGTQIKRIAQGLPVAAVGLPAMVFFVAALIGLPRFAPASRISRQLAIRLETAGIRGPIAGSALMRGGRAGLYTAFLLDEPWYGDEAKPTAASFKRSGARLIIVRRDDPVTAQLDVEAAFHLLDDRLFGTAVEAAHFPLKVYEVASR